MNFNFSLAPLKINRDLIKGVRFLHFNNGIGESKLFCFILEFSQAQVHVIKFKTIVVRQSIVGGILISNPSKSEIDQTEIA